MSSPVDSLIAGLHSRLDPTTFLAAGSIDERVEMAVRAAGVRLYSHMLAMVWADCLLAWSDRLSAEDKRFLVREMLLLSPNHEHADRLFASLASGTEAPPPNGAPIALVISCRRREYLERAVALRESLVARGTTAWIVIANPDATRAIWIDDGLVVPASDGYEGLPMKVARAIEATIERYGPCPILKIDDDSTLEREFDPHTLSRIAALHEYSGVPCRDPLHDRLWHHGKTTSPMGVYGRRFHAPWASGMCYLLGARAATLIAREAVCFPGEFSCEYYEDKAVGDFLYRQRVALNVLQSHRDLGVRIDPRERRPAPDAPGCATPAADVFRTPPVTTLPAAPITEEAAPSIARVIPIAGSRQSRLQIPRTINLIWVGDDTKRPDNCIRTWAEMNPDWTVTLWGNDDLRSRTWANEGHIAAMWDRELNGVADLMRWELLYTEGGIFVDADSICVRPLDDWLLESEAIACWENEIARPQLIGCGMLGSVPENPFFGRIIEDLHARPTVVDRMAWESVGPLCLTEAYRKYSYTGLTILPSHCFMPDHFSGTRHTGGGLTYARQEWASTHRSYDTLHMKKVS